MGDLKRYDNQGDGSMWPDPNGNWVDADEAAAAIAALEAQVDAMRADRAERVAAGPVPDGMFPADQWVQGWVKFDRENGTFLLANP